MTRNNFSSLVLWLPCGKPLVSTYTSQLPTDIPVAFSSAELVLLEGSGHSQNFETIGRCFLLTLCLRGSIAR